MAPWNGVSAAPAQRGSSRSAREPVGFSALAGSSNQFGAPVRPGTETGPTMHEAGGGVCAPAVSVQLAAPACHNKQETRIFVGCLNNKRRSLMSVAFLGHGVRVRTSKNRLHSNCAFSSESAGNWLGGG